MEISEDYEDLAKIYHGLKLEGLRGEEALLYALEPASSSSPASECRDSECKQTNFDPGSKHYWDWHGWYISASVRMIFVARSLFLKP